MPEPIAPPPSLKDQISRIAALDGDAENLSFEELTGEISRQQQATTADMFRAQPSEHDVDAMQRFAARIRQTGELNGFRQTAFPQNGGRMSLQNALALADSIRAGQ